MADLEAEDGKWANRWAACKSAELKAAGDDVPLWMAENARKGIMDAAKEKAEELQEEIDELEQEKEEETALVGAQGDVTVASQNLLGRNRKVDSTTVAHQTHVLEVDCYPILGLGWLRAHPQWAVAGASQSGTTCLIRYDEGTPGWMEQRKLPSFAHLSSLSVNCNDDFMMTSGFCMDVALYDLTLGIRMTNFRGLHQNFINILRFSNRSPHVFATASFDNTCKVWDLREPIDAKRPLRTFNTQTLNVMCAFSHDDRHVLCSGVDNCLVQFGLDERPAGGDADAFAGSSFPIPPRNSNTNYRRSHYMANGAMVATAATNETLLRFYSSEAPHRPCGHVDFGSMLLDRRRYRDTTVAAGGYVPLDGAAGPPPHAAGATESAAAAGEQEPQLSPEQSTEFVQSLRCHPKDPRRLAVLLSTTDGLPESYVSMVHMTD